MTRGLLAASACGLLLLAGCAAQRPLETETDGLELEQRRAELALLPGWRMRGRLTVDTGERAYQGRFEWRQDGDALSLTVSGPLGAGGIRVSGTEDALTLRARGEERQLENPEAQLSEALGWWLPVASLDDWLLGFPDRAYVAELETVAGGVLQSLEQRLWRLDYERFELFERWLVPRRIELKHGPLELRLVVDDWRPVAARDGA